MRSLFSLIRILISIEKILKAMLNHMERINLPEEEKEVWMDSYEVMQTYKISRSTLYRWKTSAVLVPSKIGKRDMYLKSDLEEILERGRGKT